MSEYAFKNTKFPLKVVRSLDSPGHIIKDQSDNIICHIFSIQEALSIRDVLNSTFGGDLAFTRLDLLKEVNTEIEQALKDLKDMNLEAVISRLKDFSLKCFTEIEDMKR